MIKLSAVNAANCAWMLHRRVPSLEHIIAKNAKASFSYARHVLNHRFRLGERSIIKDPEYACLYAIHILQGNWPEAESIIETNCMCWRQYQDFLRLK